MSMTPNVNDRRIKLISSLALSNRLRRSPVKLPKFVFQAMKPVNDELVGVVLCSNN